MVVLIDLVRYFIEGVGNFARCEFVCMGCHVSAKKWMSVDKLCA